MDELAPIGRPASVLLGFVAVVANAISVVGLSSQMISAAYNFAPDEVSSVDELYLVGEGPRDAIGCFALLFVVAAVITGVLLGTRSSYRFAWVAPLVAIGVSYALFFCFLSTFHVPPYRGG